MDESRGCQHSLPSIAGDIPDRSDYVSIDERQDDTQHPFVSWVSEKHLADFFIDLLCSRDTFLTSCSVN